MEDESPIAWTADDQPSRLKWWTAHLVIWATSLSLIGLSLLAALR
jgi:hypothetical protein